MLHLLDYILEKQNINFGSATAKYGQCVILAGGPASGKGFIQGKLLADFKVIDVDKFKDQYMELVKLGKIADDKKYNKKNPDDVSKLHGKVKDHEWKIKQRKAFWGEHGDSSSATHRKHLPNICWDMVCGDIDDIEKIVKYAKPAGYTVTIVWVACNQNAAIVANELRDRVVDRENVLIKNHKDAYKTMTDLFSNKYPEITEQIDYAWIGFSSSFGRKLTDKFESSPVIKIKKNEEGDKFIDFNKKEIDEFLAKPQPWNYEGKYGLNEWKKKHSEKEWNQLIKLSKEINEPIDMEQITESINNDNDPTDSYITKLKEAFEYLF